MDTKLRNNKVIRVIISIVAVVLLTLANVNYFFDISKESEEIYFKNLDQQQEIDSHVVEGLYKGIYVMYYEMTMQTNKNELLPYEVFIDSSKLDNSKLGYVEGNSDWILSDIKDRFQHYRYSVDYYASNGVIAENNSSSKLNILLESSTSSEAKALLEEYRNVWIIKFDSLGQLKIDVLKSEDISKSALSKELLRVSKRPYIAKQFNVSEMNVKDITDFEMVYGISNDSNISVSYYYEEPTIVLFKYIQEEALDVFIPSILLLLVLAYVMTSKKIWKDTYELIPSRNYLFEVALLGTYFIGLWYEWYCDRIFQVNFRGLASFQNVCFVNFSLAGFINYLDIVLITLLVFGIIYVCFLLLTPMFSMGLMEYLENYSFLYEKQESIKQYLEKLKEELSRIDLKEQTTRRILIVLAFNFIILFFVVVFSKASGWEFGTFLLLLYSLALYVILKGYVRTIVNDYDRLLESTKCIADGQLDVSMDENMGVFTSVAHELEKIQSGFKKAVEEEVKSQRMKTELITNVSHDLKTPLTAITTYVELLKQEDLSEETRREYIETLANKSNRMKVLIEDLFEVSKASSDNITLNKIKVDIVKLMKQVSFEHSSKFEEMDIKLCWNISEDIIELMLDSQKTYRIFENLFLNISKYAMPHSRVYIDIVKNETEVVVTMRNMSASPLNIPADELTERFVRGDISRNTEGSGLGLAIAKSFTEIQDGKFELVIDGDLFKTILSWKNIILKS